MIYSHKIYPLGAEIDGASLKEIFENGLAELDWVAHNGAKFIDFSLSDIEDDDLFVVSLNSNAKVVQFLQLFTNDRVAIYTKNPVEKTYTESEINQRID